MEDDTYADPEPTPSARLTTPDQLDRVIYVRSYSKTISGRIGSDSPQPHRRSSTR